VASCCLVICALSEQMANDGVRWRIKLVGKESELPRVGCVEAWQRRRTTVFFRAGFWL
jgi:hypothetical protein